MVVLHSHRQRLGLCQCITSVLLLQQLQKQLPPIGGPMRVHRVHTYPSCGVEHDMALSDLARWLMRMNFFFIFFDRRDV